MKKIVYTIFLIGILSTNAVLAQHNLEFAPTANSTYRLKQETEQLIKQSIYGMDQEMTNTVSAILVLKVTGSTPDYTTVEFSIEEITSEMKNPMQPMKMSSVDPKEGDIPSQLFYNITKNKMILKIDREGNIIESEGDDAFFNDAVNELNISDAMKEQVRTSMSQNVSGESFIQSIEMITRVLPDKKVAVGESWKSEHKMEAMVQALYNTEFTLKEAKGKEFLVSGVSDIQAAEDTVKVNGMDVQYLLDGNQDAKYNINREGVVIGADINATLKGKVIFAPNPQMPDGMEVPMTVVSKSIYTLLD